MKTKDGISPDLDCRKVRNCTNWLLGVLDEYRPSVGIDDMVRIMMSQAGVVELTTRDSKNGEWMPSCARNFMALDWGFKLGMKLGSTRRKCDRAVLRCAFAWLMIVVKFRKQ